VTQISASHFDDDTAYVSVSGLRIDEQRPAIFRTHDRGTSWQLITDGLPQSPVDTVREDPVRKGLLYAGTETAVWVSFDDGAHWRSLQLNLPHTSMRDLMVRGDDLIVATHGRGFWILDDIAPLRQMTAEVAGAEAFLFRPAEAVRVRRSLNSDTPLPADEPAGENPPDGAIIDYVLGAGVSGPVTLEIVDAAGHPVRRYSSTDRPWITDEELAKQTIPPYWVKLPETLRGDAGMHRWVWDLHYEAPLATEYSYPIAAVPHRTPRSPLGPLALPGTYTVRLIAGGRTLTAPLTVTIDPRVATPPAGIAQMFDVEMRLADMLTRSSRALLEARSAAAQLDKLSGVRGGTKNLVEAFRKELTEITSGPAEPPAKAAAQLPAKTTEAAAQRETPKPPEAPTLRRVQGDAAALYESIDRADAAPTAAQMHAVDQLTTELEGVMKRWDALRSTSLVRLNGELGRQHMGPIRPVAERAGGEGGEHEK
jgi:hypothetical protein